VLALLLTPAVLSSLVLAAHFLRRGQLLPCACCVALVALAFVHRPWARRVWQGFLGLGVLVWLQTLSSVARTRLEHGEPWLRPALILGGVAAFTLLAAVLLEHRRVYARYHPVDAPPRD
jgi:glucose-6-phosphate-specific signal transduction histidine kinase